MIGTAWSSGLGVLSIPSDLVQCLENERTDLHYERTDMGGGGAHNAVLFAYKQRCTKRSWNLRNVMDLG